MDAATPWAALMEVVKPHYFEGRRGRKPIGIERMLRMYFLQLWFNFSDKGVMMRGDSIVDATIIQAPSSTKNASGGRDPAMHHAKKDQQWYLGMKTHIGVGAGSGLVHTAEFTAANEHDVESRKVSVCSKVEHAFLTVKRQFGYAKCRYRGIAKNASALTVLFALANVVMRPRTGRICPRTLARA